MYIPAYWSPPKTSLKGSAASVDIWRDSVIYDQFTINEHQKKDRQC